VVISAPLINAVLVRPDGWSLTYLIAGTVDSGLLEQAAVTLTTQDASS